MPLRAVAPEPPLITGVNCCHVEFVLVCGWSGLAVDCCCCCDCWDVRGGGELTGVDGFELKLLILWSVDVNIVCMALPTIVSFWIAGLCCECGWLLCGWCASGWLYSTGDCGAFEPVVEAAVPRNVLMGGKVWLCKFFCLFVLIFFLVFVLLGVFVEVGEKNNILLTFCRFNSE